MSRGPVHAERADSARRKRSGLLESCEAGLNDLGKEGSAEGFRFFHFFELAAQQPDAGEALRTMSGWIKEGKLKYRESVTHGLDSSVDAFIGMLRGENFGKTMVQIS